MKGIFFTCRIRRIYSVSLAREVISSSSVYEVGQTLSLTQLCRGDDGSQEELDGWRGHVWWRASGCRRRELWYLGHKRWLRAQDASGTCSVCGVV